MEVGKGGEMSLPWLCCKRFHLAYRLTLVSLSLLAWEHKWLCWKTHVPRSWRQPLNSSQKEVRAFSLTTARRWFLQQPEWTWKQIHSMLNFQVRTQSWPKPWLQPCRTHGQTPDRSIPNFLRNLCVVFRSGCTSSHSDRCLYFQHGKRTVCTVGALAS